jgi:hypothetical protein
MTAKTASKPEAKTPFGVRLPNDLLAALYQRAAKDRRSVTVTTELVIAAGLAALERRTPRKGRAA